MAVGWAPLPDSAAGVVVCADHAALVRVLDRVLTDERRGPDDAVLEAHAPTFHNQAAILEARLAGQQWLCGPDVTLADIAVAAPMHLHSYQKLPLESYPNLRGWMDRVEALPCWQRSDPRPLLGLA